MHRGGVSFVGLQVYIEVAAAAEHARDAGNQLLAIFDQRIGCLLARLLRFPRVEKRIGHRHALAAQHHGTHGQADEFFVQVRNNKIRLIGADSSGLRIPRQELDRVLPRKQRESRRRIARGWTPAGSPPRPSA